ncbi:hypothetical protein [Bacillus alveayuensis]|jgi:hypothetical protein|uniref:hypothetical protein n=1 Tax=Aeribacillus alveayuensis TaxID=279215 RepID=UPI0005CC9A19|nr:hypothetical protein [Bacillus alveayuensis]
MNGEGRVLEIRRLSKLIIQTKLQEGYQLDPRSLLRAVELLSEAIYDFSILQSDEPCDEQEMLKGTLAKMRIAYNIVSTGQKPNEHTVF